MSKTPEEIELKLRKVQEEIDKTVETAFNCLKTNLSGEVSFKFECCAPRDILTDFERAQSVCFITRYKALPIFDKIKVVEYSGKYHLGNYSYVRHVLNEYRSLIQNQKDSIYYRHIHHFCRKKLLNQDYSKDLSISVNHIELGDVTKLFVKVLDEKTKVIKSIINQCDYTYIYNGILQHSDHKFTEKFWEDYMSGEIYYIFIKHAWLLGHIKDLLEWHYRILNSITFPKLGSL